MKLNLPVPFYPLDEVASEWGYTTRELLAMAQKGELQIGSEMLAGEQCTVIYAEERARLEQLYGAAGRRRPVKAALRADARRSYEDVIASLLALSFGSDSAILKPYERTKELQQLAARIALPMTRSGRKYAAILASAGALLRDCGFIAEPEQQAETASPKATPVAETDAQIPAKTISAQQAM